MTRARRCLALVVATAFVILISGACKGGGDGGGGGGAAGATKSFLDALVAGKAAEAFEQTTLTAGATQAEGVTSAIDRDHFVAVFTKQPVSGYRVISRSENSTRVELTTPVGTEEVLFIEVGGKVVVPTRQVNLDVDGGELPGLSIGGLPVQLAAPEPTASLPLVQSARLRYRLLVIAATVEAEIPAGPVSQAQTVRLPAGQTTVDVSLTPAPDGVNAARAALDKHADGCGADGCEVRPCVPSARGGVFRLGASGDIQIRRDRLVHEPPQEVGYVRGPSVAWVMTLEARTTATNGIDRFDLLAVAEFGDGGTPRIALVCHTPPR